eukprot:Sspe_Gene.117117::Locus_107791_Transcript_1_1_Confidence_1.000_Length_536::g.117117::m.117117
MIAITLPSLSFPPLEDTVQQQRGALPAALTILVALLCSPLLAVLAVGIFAAAGAVLVIVIASETWSKYQAQRAAYRAHQATKAAAAALTSRLPPELVHEMTSFLHPRTGCAAFPPPSVARAFIETCPF